MRVALAVVLASCATLPAQITWIVDASGGPGSTFTDLPAAFGVASPGDTLLVRAGTYTPVTTSKGVTLLGEPGAVLNTDPVVGGRSFVLVGMPSWQTFVIEGFRNNGQIWHFPVFHALRTRGIVHLDRVQFRNGQPFPPVFWDIGPGIAIEDCDYVTIVNSTIEGAPGLLVEDSVVSLSGSRIDGMDAFSYHEPILPSFRALEARRSELFAAQLVVEGGRGIQTIWGLQPASPAVQLTDCATLFTGDSNALCAAGAAHQPGAPTPALEVVGGSLTLDPSVTLVARGSAPTIRASGATVVMRRVPSATAAGAPPGQSVPVDLFAVAGHSGVLLIGAPAVSAPTPFGALALALPFVAGSGTVAANGRLGFGLPVPARNDLLGATPGLQFVTLDPATSTIELSLPVVVVLH